MLLHRTAAYETLDDEPGVLCHYTSLESARNILESRKLWAPRVYFLNDASEVASSTLRGLPSAITRVSLGHLVARTRRLATAPFHYAIEPLEIGLAFRSRKKRAVSRAGPFQQLRWRQID